MFEKYFEILVDTDYDIKWCFFYHSEKQIIYMCKIYNFNFMLIKKKRLDLCGIFIFGNLSATVTTLC